MLEEERSTYLENKGIQLFATQTFVRSDNYNDVLSHKVKAVFTETNFDDDHAYQLITVEHGVLNH